MTHSQDWDNDLVGIRYWRIYASGFTPDCQVSAFRLKLRAHTGICEGCPGLRGLGTETSVRWSSAKCPIIWQSVPYSTQLLQ
jgi:hypothetical protein